MTDGHFERSHGDDGSRLPEALRALAAASGVLTWYWSAEGEQMHADPDILVRVLRMLRAPIERADDAADALVHVRRRAWSRLVPPCAVSWDGADAILAVTVPAAADGSYQVEFAPESGEAQTRSGALVDLPVIETPDAERAAVIGEPMVRRRLAVAVPGVGYHRAVVRAGGREAACLIIAAPGQAHSMPPGRHLGVFAPLYALRREPHTIAERARGGRLGPDLGDLSELGAWTAKHGGRYVGTLPLLAGYLSEPFEPSPYAPVTRLFFNELYLDLSRAPGLDASERARALLTPERAAEAAALAAEPELDYRRQMALAQPVIQALADDAFATPALRATIDSYLRAHPSAADYARFRAAVAQRGQVWLSWPEPQRGGRLEPGDWDEGAFRYHAYAQMAMAEQLAAIDASGAGLYLDLPVGVARGGYDVWRHRTSFAVQASCGAPPDALFSGGQDWGLPPLVPEASRESGHRYFIDSVRAHARHASLLRVDHVMGLYRLYWVPDGVSAKDGIYVRYPDTELLAITCLESHRNQCAVAGEDLGTVPDEVRAAMAERHLARLFVGQFAMPTADGDASTAPPEAAVASLNTHDMATFAGFWQGSEIDVRREMGLLDDDEAARQHVERKALRRQVEDYVIAAGLVVAAQVHRDANATNTETNKTSNSTKTTNKQSNLSEKSFLLPDGALLRAYLQFLASSDARLVLLTLEDLWLEPSPQNVPGTTFDERSNWRRKCARTMESFMSDPDIAALIAELARRRGE